MPETQQNPVDRVIEARASRPERKLPEPTITPETFKPYGEYDEWADEDREIMKAEVDGVEWLTDRHLLIRADLVAPQPAASHLFKMTPGATQTIVEFVQRIMKIQPMPEHDPKKLLAPIYVEAFEDSGLDLVPSPTVWLIQFEGETVGCIAPTSRIGDGFGGILPGQIEQAHRAVERILRGDIVNRWYRWNAAFLAVDAARKADQ